MFNYSFQPPYLYNRYRSSVRQYVQENDIKVSLSSLDQVNIKNESSDAFSTLVSSVWTSLRLKSSLFETKSCLIDVLSNVKRPYLLDIKLTLKNSFDDPYIVGLFQCSSWDRVLLALSDNNSVIVGGAVYSSFEKALVTGNGVIPMPSEKEDLLGSHAFNLVSFNRDTDLGVMIGNLGPSVGDRGLFYVTGSYLRNLSINKDFFVLTMESMRGLSGRFSSKQPQ
jgi:hypothetical protein